MGSVWSRRLRPALNMVNELLPASGEIEDLLDALSKKRGRPMRLLTADLGPARSGLLLSTDAADYIVVSSDTSPERSYAICCHEVAHALLGHDHEGGLAESIIDSGMFAGLDKDLVRKVVAARKSHGAIAPSPSRTNEDPVPMASPGQSEERTHTDSPEHLEREGDAELLATHISLLLRERMLRGGHTYFDDRWR